MSTNPSIIQPNQIREVPAAMSGTDTNAPAANTAAVAGYGAVGGYSHVVSGIAWSYSAAPTGGNLIVQDGSTTIFQVDVTAAGPGFFPFFPPRFSTPGNALTATLSAGGSGISGKVNFLGHWIIPEVPGVYPGYDFRNPLNSFYL